MEESRCLSRVTIHDPVYDSIQNSRYKRHAETLKRLRSEEKKSNSHYHIRPYPSETLEKARKVKQEAQARLFPSDTEYKQCLKKIENVRSSFAKLPKISNTKITNAVVRR